jgi:hypothetical protein
MVGCLPAAEGILKLKPVIGNTHVNIARGDSLVIDISGRPLKIILTALHGRTIFSDEEEGRGIGNISANIFFNPLRTGCLSRSSICLEDSSRHRFAPSVVFLNGNKVDSDSLILGGLTDNEIDINFQSAGEYLRPPVQVNLGLLSEYPDGQIVRIDSLIFDRQHR